MVLGFVEFSIGGQILIFIRQGFRVIAIEDSHDRKLVDPGTVDCEVKHLQPLLTKPNIFLTVLFCWLDILRVPISWERKYVSVFGFGPRTGRIYVAMEV